MILLVMYVLCKTADSYMKLMALGSPNIHLLQCEIRCNLYRICWCLFSFGFADIDRFFEKSVPTITKCIVITGFTLLCSSQVHVYWSTTTLKPLIVEVNSVDHTHTALKWLLVTTFGFFLILRLIVFLKHLCKCVCVWKPSTQDGAYIKTRQF